MRPEDEEEVRIAIENNEYIANSHVKELLEEIDLLREKCKVDGEIFNLGRSEGHSDIKVKFRKLVDPEDKNHFNLEGVLKEVEHLVNFKNQATELLDIIRQSDALKEFACERGDDDLSIREQLTLLLGGF